MHNCFNAFQKRFYELIPYEKLNRKNYQYTIDTSIVICIEKRDTYEKDKFHQLPTERKILQENVSVSGLEENH